MENWWGNQFRRYAGHVISSYTNYYKMTRGTQDGSSATDYNLDGTGYIEGAAVPLSNGYVTKSSFNGNTFTYNQSGGSSAVYWCDGYTAPTSTVTTYPLRSGNAATGVGAVGAFFSLYSALTTSKGWYIGAAPSCKPYSNVS